MVQQRVGSRTLPNAPRSFAAGEQEAALRAVDGHPDWPGEAHTAVTSSAETGASHYIRPLRQSVNSALWYEYQIVNPPHTVFCIPTSTGQAT
jgi:hypothetical protein